MLALYGIRRYQSFIFTLVLAIFDLILILKNVRARSSSEHQMTYVREGLCRLGNEGRRLLNMIRQRVPMVVLLVVIGGCVSSQREEPALSVAATADAGADRTALREDFLEWRFGLFLHFNMSTYIDREWATGYEDPALFRPDKLDCGQWADLARAAGMQYGVLTVKHTGGWCLWDSEHTTHDAAGFVNFKNGKGDVVREFVDAFRARGLKIGFYYCFPGNFANTQFSAPVPEGLPDLHGLPPEAAGDYVGFIQKQLTELLTKYGPIDVLWIDQYRNRYTFRSWQEIRAHINALQPKCVVIGNNAHDLSESDIYSCEFPWQSSAMPPEGNTIPAEVCYTISGTWFWNSSNYPGNVRSAQDILAMVKRCNERHANYLLNVPPDRDGLISGACLERMRELAQYAEQRD